ncbi:hypothetical protein [Pseudomonas syringae]|uniref:hypothetical protein n=1 Tax=Pseudomonas syringae TaxID=317 RepID=UPI000EFF6976|nr:hypothetical protein [Pseudomonas syringae]MCK9744291.1 hypothetical protein [Pseudomonas syringae pv. syringae]MCK9768006.1 hypothetical protein [Pseudomonas syringae pv. syringae]
MNSLQLESLRLKLLEVSALDFQALTLPAMEKLFGRLSEIAEDASDFQKMLILKNSILEINELAEKIDTEDGEIFLDFFYSAATIAGFSNKGNFAEQWRGDW